MTDISGDVTHTQGRYFVEIENFLQKNNATPQNGDFWRDFSDALKVRFGGITYDIATSKDFLTASIGTFNPTTLAVSGITSIATLTNNFYYQTGKRVFVWCGFQVVASAGSNATFRITNGPIQASPTNTITGLISGNQAGGGAGVMSGYVSGGGGNPPVINFSKPNAGGTYNIIVLYSFLIP